MPNLHFNEIPADTKMAIEKAYREHGTVLEPHGAVAWEGLDRYIRASPHPGMGTLYVSLETAHPAKFPERIKEMTGVVPEVPNALKMAESGDEHFRTIDADYHTLKSFLLKDFQPL